jgi:hypothetical protein
MHAQGEFTSSYTGKRYKIWVTESGLAYSEEVVDGVIEDLISGNSKVPRDQREARGTKEFSTTDQQKKILTRVFHQGGSMQLDGVLYTNLIDEIKRGTPPREVLSRAREWGMQSARIPEEEGGFPRPREDDQDNANWLRGVALAPARFVGDLVRNVALKLQSLAGRMVALATNVIIPLNSLLNWFSFSAFGVNLGLPPSFSVEFEPTQGPQPVGEFLSMLTQGIPIPVPA